MSGAMSAQVKARRALVRFVLLLVYAGLIAVMFYFGKGHVLLLDNKDSEDGSIKAFESVTVAVDGQEPTDLSAGDRDQAKVRGQKHTMEITVKDGQKVTTQFRVPVGADMALVSIPKLLAGNSSAVQRFVPLDEAVPPVPEPESSSPSGTPEAGGEAHGATGEPGSPEPPKP